MASIRREILVRVPADVAWDAVRDVGAVHTRLAVGFVTDTTMEDDARVVTFHTGLVARELIVDIDETAKRLVWAVVGPRLKHHNASLQLFAEGPGSTRIIWVADLLPHEMSGMVAGMIDDGMVAMKATLERDHKSA